ncbi:MAG: hypothetical protein EBU90_05770 [Proteobacteria bacterium]|nr:hypothetical protein [Pseudomonadota bacterium]NBP15439.1 hypothetical protein [bacterium]
MKNLLLFVVLWNVTNMFSGEFRLTTYVLTPTQLTLWQRFSIPDGKDTNGNDNFNRWGFRRSIEPLLGYLYRIVYKEKEPITITHVGVTINGQEYQAPFEKTTLKRLSELTITVSPQANPIEGADQQYHVDFKLEEEENPSRCAIQ